MDNEVTNSEYWDKYWEQNKGSLPSYDLYKGLFYSYDMLLQRLVKETRRRMGKERLRVIDCGCGDGLILRYLSERFDDIEVSGIEYSDSIVIAQKMAEQLGYQISLTKWDMNNGMPKNMLGKFDMVLSFGLIEHFNEPLKILEVMKSALAPGGCMMTVIPNFDGLYNLLWRLYDQENYRQHVPIKAGRLRQLHERLGLEAIECFRLGNPTIPGIHNVRRLWEKAASTLIINLNGRILQKLAPRQERLDKSYPLAPVVVCTGVALADGK